MGKIDNARSHDRLFMDDDNTYRDGSAVCIVKITNDVEYDGSQEKDSVIIRAKNAKTGSDTHKPRGR